MGLHACRRNIHAFTKVDTSFLVVFGPIDGHASAIRTSPFSQSVPLHVGPRARKTGRLEHIHTTRQNGIRQEDYWNLEAPLAREFSEC